MAVGGAGRGSGGVPVPVNAHPQAIDLVDMQSELASPPNMQSFGPKVGTSQLDAPTTGTSVPGPITGTLLAWCAVIPTLWTAAMIVLSVNVRF